MLLTKGGGSGGSCYWEREKMEGKRGRCGGYWEMKKREERGIPMKGSCCQSSIVKGNVDRSFLQKIESQRVPLTIVAVKHLGFIFLILIVGSSDPMVQITHKSMV